MSAPRFSLFNVQRLAPSRRFTSNRPNSIRFSNQKSPICPGLPVSTAKGSGLGSHQEQCFLKNKLIVTTVSRFVLAGYGLYVGAGPRKRLSRPHRLPCVVFGHVWSFSDIMTQKMMTSRRKRRHAVPTLATRGHHFLSHYV